jgi:hypothetical protein
MMKLHSLIRWSFLAGLLLNATAAFAQFTTDGDFRTRWYSDRYSDALDNRGPENYLRYYGSIRAQAHAGAGTIFHTELVIMTDNPASPVRNIAGTGVMRYGIREIYAEFNQPNFLLFDLARFRIGRQQFPIGDGLSLGESYNPNKFDGGRVDLAKSIFTLSMFGAITGQNLSSSGLYPDPGSDQLWAARLGARVKSQDIMGYYLLQRVRGPYNDSYILGAGMSGSIVSDKFLYSWELAHQSFNVAPGLPDKRGTGAMGTLSYQWGMGPFRSIKVETKYALMQGDDSKTSTVEQFSPLYASYYWGIRAGYVDGDIGGDFPHNGLDPEGSRIWYSRIYFTPSILPKLRLQFQYVKVNEFVNNDGINSMDDEWGVRLYYSASSQVQWQIRYSRTIPNDRDYDFDGNGYISSIEDRYAVTSLMLETQIHF